MTRVVALARRSGGRSQLWLTCSGTVAEDLISQVLTCVAAYRYECRGAGYLRGSDGGMPGLARVGLMAMQLSMRNGVVARTDAW